MKKPTESRFQKILTGHGIIFLGLISVVLLTVTLQGANIVGLLASATSSFATAPAIFYFTPYDSKTMQIGDMTQVDINVNAHVPINAVGITIKYPPDLLEIVAVSKAKSFLNLWTEDTVIREDIGEVHFSGGTTMKGGLVGTSTALTLTIEAKAAGQATLSFEDDEAYASDGTGTSLAARTRSLTFTIPAPATPPAVAALSGGSTTPAPLQQPTPPSPDLNGDGTVNIVDVSIMLIHMISPYDPRYDLNGDGTVGIGDLSILLSKIGTKD